MSWDTSKVMREFAKIAEDKDLLMVKTAAPSPNPHKEDKKVVEEKRLKKKEKSILEEAHPKPVYIAEARGDGGLVENEIETHKKIMEIVNKMPTGTLVGRYATTISKMVKLAEYCDEIGEQEAADMLTENAADMVEKLADKDFFQ